MCGEDEESVNTRTEVRASGWSEGTGSARSEWSESGSGSETQEGGSGGGAAAGGRGG